MLLIFITILLFCFSNLRTLFLIVLEVFIEGFEVLFHVMILVFLSTIHVSMLVIGFGFSSCLSYLSFIVRILRFFILVVFRDLLADLRNCFWGIIFSGLVILLSVLAFISILVSRSYFYRLHLLDLLVPTQAFSFSSANRIFYLSKQIFKCSFQLFVVSTFEPWNRILHFSVKILLKAYLTYLLVLSRFFIVVSLSFSGFCLIRGDLHFTCFFCLDHFSSCRLLRLFTKLLIGIWQPKLWELWLHFVTISAEFLNSSIEIRQIQLSFMLLLTFTIDPWFSYQSISSK